MTQQLDCPADYVLTVEYTNHRGETAVRRLRPLSVYFGSTAWHPTPQLLMKAMDLDKGAERDFAVADLRPAPPARVRDAWDAVIADARAMGAPAAVVEAMRGRQAKGLADYGVPVSPDRDEDWLRHCYEELLDAAVYARAHADRAGGEDANWLYRLLLRTAAFDVGRLAAGTAPGVRLTVAVDGGRPVPCGRVTVTAARVPPVDVDGTAVGGTVEHAFTPAGVETKLVDENQVECGAGAEAYADLVKGLYLYG